MPPEADYGYKQPFAFEPTEWAALSYQIIYLTGRIAAIDQVAHQHWESLKNPILSQESSTEKIKQVYHQELQSGNVIKMDKVKIKFKRGPKPRKHQMPADEYQRRVREVLG